MKVTYELISPDGHFVCHLGDGSEIRVEAGKNLTTGDPVVIRELDAASHAVRRAKSPSKDEEE